MAIQLPGGTGRVGRKTQMPDPSSQAWASHCAGSVHVRQQSDSARVRGSIQCKGMGLVDGVGCRRTSESGTGRVRTIAWTRACDLLHIRVYFFAESSNPAANEVHLASTAVANTSKTALLRPMGRQARTRVSGNGQPSRVDGSGSASRRGMSEILM